MEQIQAYQASDGAIFKTVDECLDHELSLLWRQRIDDFQKSGLSPYPSGVHSSMCARVIVAWERFKTGA
jgi:hypothetical protein